MGQFVAAHNSRGTFRRKTIPGAFTLGRGGDWIRRYVSDAEEITNFVTRRQCLYVTLEYSSEAWLAEILFMSVCAVVGLNAQRIRKQLRAWEQAVAVASAVNSQS
jgi:hypothetical protein